MTAHGAGAQCSVMRQKARAERAKRFYRDKRRDLIAHGDLIARRGLDCPRRRSPKHSRSLHRLWSGRQPLDVGLTRPRLHLCAGMQFRGTRRAWAARRGRTSRHLSAILGHCPIGVHGPEGKRVFLCILCSFRDVCITHSITRASDNLHLVARDATEPGNTGQAQCPHTTP